MTAPPSGIRFALEGIDEITFHKVLRDLIIESGMEVGMQEGMDLLEEVAISLRS